MKMTLSIKGQLTDRSKAEPAEERQMEVFARARLDAIMEDFANEGRLRGCVSWRTNITAYVSGPADPVETLMRHIQVTHEDIDCIINDASMKGTCSV